MKTFYEILEIKRNASNDEIVEAYDLLSKKYKDDENRLKELNVAKLILLNSEARENYDKKLKEMEEAKIISDLNKNTINNNNLEKQKVSNVEKATETNLEKNKVSYESIKNFKVKQSNNENVENIKQENNIEKNSNQEIDEKTLKKIQKQEQRAKNKAQKKQEQIRNELYQEAYAKYLKGLGYDVKMPWTRKRVKNLLIAIISVVISCIILWLIPPIRNYCKQIYSNNMLVKIFVDIIGSILKAIWNFIKSLFKVGD